MNSELSTITEELRKSKTELTNILGVSSITDIADGLKQLRQIKADIKAAASSELGVSIPDGTPFAGWAVFIDGTPPIKRTVKVYSRGDLITLEQTKEYYAGEKVEILIDEAFETVYIEDISIGRKPKNLHMEKTSDGNSLITFIMPDKDFAITHYRLGNWPGHRYGFKNIDSTLKNDKDEYWDFTVNFIQHEEDTTIFYHGIKYKLIDDTNGEELGEGKLYNGYNLLKIPSGKDRIVLYFYPQESDIECLDMANSEIIYDLFSDYNSYDSTFPYPGNPSPNYYQSIIENQQFLPENYPNAYNTNELILGHYNSCSDIELSDLYRSLTMQPENKENGDDPFLIDIHFKAI